MRSLCLGRLGCLRTTRRPTRGSAPICPTDQEIWKVSAVRLLLIPAIAIVLLLFIPLDHMSKIILLTGTAAPCALASAMFGQIYGTDYLFSTRVISLSTLLSVITLPLCISVLEGLLHFFG